MKNPLPVTLWLLDQDARNGLLRQRGFTATDHPHLDGPVYSRDGFHLHTSCCWLEQGSSRLLYSACGHRFYRTEAGGVPEHLPADAERIPLQDGFTSFYPFLRDHEEWVVDTFGPDYRTRQLSKLPPSSRRYAKNWKVHFSDVLRQQPARTR